METFEQKAHEIYLKNYAINGDGEDGQPPMTLKNFIDVDLSDKSQQEYYNQKLKTNN